MSYCDGVHRQVALVRCEVRDGGDVHGEEITMLTDVSNTGSFTRPHIHSMERCVYMSFRCIYTNCIYKLVYIQACQGRGAL